MRAKRKRVPAVVQLSAKRADVVAGEVQSWQSRQNLGAYDQLPYAVRAAVSECPFLVDITRCPKGFDWPQAIERIKAVTTFKEAEESDRWLLMCGLRGRR